jgi:hypothetical protein
MNNITTGNLTAIVAVLMAATLVVGTFATVAAVTQQSAFAAIPQKKPPGHDDKKDKARDNDGSGNGNGNTVTIEECKNGGSASGFDTALDQECENLICTHPGENATCVQEGAAAAQAQAQPVKLTCEQCFTKFLSSSQISELVTATEVTSLEQVCARLPTITGIGLAEFLVGELGVSESTAFRLVQCLLDAGIVFSTEIP